MHWIRIGLICAGALLAAIVIVVVLLFTMDLGRFKPQAEDLVSDQLGRRIHIDGIFQPSLGAEIRLIAEDIRLDNPDWAAGESLLRAQRLDVSLDTWALLSGRILLNNLELNDMAIALEQDETGSNNWTLLESEPAEEADDSESTLDLLILQARIRDLTVTYDEPSRDSPIRFHAAAIDQVQLESGDLQLELDGDLNGTPVTLDVTAGSFANLLSAGQVHYDLDGDIGEISISSNAQIDSLAEPREPVGHLNISGPDAKYLTDVLGIAPITQGPLDLVATIEPVADKMNLKILGEFGEFEIDVLGSFSDLQEFDDVNIDFSAAGPNAATFGDLTGLDGIPPDPYSIRGNVRGEGETAIAGTVAIEIGETEFDVSATIDNFPDIDGSVVSLKIDGPEFGRFNKLLGLPGKLTGPFRLTADLSQSPDGEELIDIDAAARDIQFRVNGVVSTEPEFVGTKLALSVKGENLSVITDALDIPDVPGVPFDVNAKVSRPDRGFAIEDGIVTLGADVIRLDGLVGLEPLASDTDIKFEISGPDLGETLALLQMDPDKIPDGVYRAGGRIHREDAGFVLEQIVATLGAKEDYRVEADGLLTEPPGFVGTRLNLSARGASLRDVGEIAEVSGLPPASFRVSGTVNRRQEGFAVTDGEFQVAEDKLRVEGLVGNEPLERDTDLRFEVSGPDLVGTLNMAGVELEALPPGSYEAAGRVRRRAEYIELDGITARLGSTRARLGGRLGNLTDFQGTDIDITIDGDSLARLVPEVSGYTFRDVPFNVASKVQLARDTVNLRGLNVRIGQGELRGDVEIGMSPVLGAGSVELTANGPDVAEWVPSFAQYVPVTAPFDLTGGVHWTDSHVTVDGLDLKLAKGRLVANGNVDVADFSRTDFEFDAQVASMSNLGLIAGRDLPDDPLTLSAHLIGSTGVLRLEDLRATAGSSDLSGRATYDSQGEVPSVDVGLASTYLNLVPFLPAEEATAEPEPTAPADDSRVIPDTPIPLDLLQQLNARVNVSIGELVLRETTVNDVLVLGSLQDGALRIEKFGLAGRRGTLDGTLEVLPTPDGARISTVVDGTGMTLGLTPSSPDAVDRLPSYDIQLKLAAGGATVRDVAASLDGTLRLVGGSGQLKSLPGWFLRDVTAEVVNTVNPFVKKEGFAKIQCFAILLRSVAGQVDGVPALVLQTDKLNIVGVAFIDLATEEIDVKIETAARKGLGIGVADFVTPYTKIGGTMAEPKLAFDTEEAVARGAETVATLGTAWIAKKVKNRFFSPKDPCGEEVSKADEEMKNISGER